MKNKQIMIIETTSFCNSRCKHCLRTHSTSGSYNFSYADLMIALDEIKEFSKNFDSFELKISGGEPTIWRDGEYNILDLLEQCEKRELNYSLVTNGKLFANKEYCKTFFENLKQRNVLSLNIFCTIDNFHENYFMESPILDNLLSVDSVKLNITVQSTCSTDKDFNISADFIKKYFDQGIKFIINPLLPWGKGIDCSNIPTLKLNSNNKESLGDYKKYFFILGKSMGVWNSIEEFENIDNFKAIKQFNNCGKTITLDRGNYYYCMPRSDESNFCFAKLGCLNVEDYKNFIKSNEVIQKCLKNDFDLKNLDIDVPFGYGICDICKKFL